MLFRRKRGTDDQAVPGATGAGSAPAPEPEEQSSPSLARVLKQIAEQEKPEILDLGPLCGDSVVYLAGKGGRVSVESFTPPPAPVKPKQGEEAPPRPPLRIDQPDGTFDLVLAWEQLDFVPPECLDEFGAELARILAPGGQLLVLARASGGEEQEVCPQYRIVGDDRIQRQPSSGSMRRRWNHPTRAVERALGAFSIKGIHLQRNQIREFLAVRK